jgi:hypothetical protein
MATSGPNLGGTRTASTPAATLRAPLDSLYDATKAKGADRKVLLDLFLSEELWSLVDPLSIDASFRGTPIPLIHAVLRQYAGAHGLDWEPFLGGGIIGKIIGEAIKTRLAKGQKYYEPGELTGQLL